MIRIVSLFVQHCRQSLFKRALAITLSMLSFAALASAQSWTLLTNQPNFGAGTALLLTDGTAMVHQSSTGNWWRLTPDSFGNYANGTWSQLASLPAGHAPLYFASAVLPDGRVVVEGGEFNNGQMVWTTLGAIYNPVNNAWTSIVPPSGWTTIGDAQSVVLPNGTFMLANCCTTQAALLNASNLTWTPTGTSKADSNNEEGWTLLPNGKVLAVDTRNGTNSELFDPATGSWSSAGSTIVVLQSGSEMGPAVLRPDGRVLAAGANSNTAIFNTSTGGWSVGPTLPNGLAINDGPAAALPNGNVLLDTSPPSSTPSQFFEFNGTSLLSVPAPANASGHHAFEGRMLVLPSGQILFTDGTSVVQLYTPSGSFQSAWQPTITSVATTLTSGTTNNSISGTQFNGLSQGAAYGDDAQAASNYPLVRIKNNATAHVVYARTHNHSTMGVATGSTVVSTLFDIPSTIETGASTLQVIANGIPSNSLAVTIASPPSQARGTIVVSGAPYCDPNNGCDAGTAQITMNGRTETIVYDGMGVNGPGTTQGIAMAFANAFNTDSGSFVTAIALQDANPPYNWDINVVTKATGNVNYVFSTAINQFCPGCSPLTFSLTPTVGQLTGGH